MQPSERTVVDAGNGNTEPEAPRIDLKTRLFGLHPSRLEITTALFFACVGLTVAVLFALRADPPIWMLVFAGILGFDLFGGIAVTASAAGKRWYHRERPRARLHTVLFAVAHIHPFLIAAVSAEFTWVHATWVYVAAVVGVTMVAFAPPGLQRPLSLAGVAVALAGVAFLSPLDSWAWLAPAFLVKLVAAHAPRPGG